MGFAVAGVEWEPCLCCMITRSGRTYQSTMSQEGTEEASTLADLMKRMIEDRRKREEEIANERERRDRKVEARVQEMTWQMEVW